MIELRTDDTSLSINDLYIEDLNNILVINYVKLYEFLNLFFNSNSKLYIGNSKIDNKNSYIINLLDYESIANQLTLKKGTILYEYLIDELTEKTELTYIKEEIDFKLKKLVDEATVDKTIDYDFEFDIDLSKIITNYIKFEIDLSIINYTKIIKILIYNLKRKNLKKMIILLINTNIFDNLLDDIEDIKIFKFYSNDTPNILVGNEIVNIDINLITNQLMLNWPTKIDAKKAKDVVKNFLIDCKNSKIIVNNIELYIGYKIILKVLNVNLECVHNLCVSEIPPIYKNYLNSL